MQYPNSTTNIVREHIARRVERLTMVGGFTEQEICNDALALLKRYTQDANKLRSQWRTYQDIRADLFRSQGGSR